MGRLASLTKRRRFAECASRREAVNRSITNKAAFGATLPFALALGRDRSPCFGDLHQHDLRPGERLRVSFISWMEARVAKVARVSARFLEILGETPASGQEARPRNRRTEMWQRSCDWLSRAGGADLPDDNSLQANACAPGYGYDMNQRLLLETKGADAASRHPFDE
jgi:hypothetical protein